MTLAIRSECGVWKCGVLEKIRKKNVFIHDQLGITSTERIN